MSHQASAPHEVEGHLKFNEFGLSPYWGLGQLLHQSFGGHGETTLETGGETWEVTLAYSKSGIAPRDTDSLNAEVLYEYEIHAEGNGQRKAHFNVSPRFETMRNPDGEELSIPWPGGEGIDVTFQGSNLEPDEYLELLPEACLALAREAGKTYRADYFDAPMSESNIYSYERYLRVDRAEARKVVRQDGIMNRIFQLLAEEEGKKWEFHGDNEDVLGKLTRLVLHEETARDLMPMHRLGKQVKHYHPKHVRTDDDGDSLFHPKVGALTRQSLNSESIAWSDRYEAAQELEETLINILNWAGVPTRPDDDVFIPDDHFSVRPSDLTIERYDDPTPTLEAKQEHVLMRALGDMTETSGAVLEQLATDGGQHVRDLADGADRHRRTIYRALDDLGELVRNENGEVSIRSEKLKQDVLGIIDQTEQTLETAAERVGRLVNMDVRQEADSGLSKWMSKYGATLERDEDGNLETIRFDTMLARQKSLDAPHVSDVLAEGLEAWSRTRDPLEFTTARVEFRSALTGELMRRPFKRLR